MYLNENNPVLSNNLTVHIIKTYIFIIALSLSPLMYSLANDALTYESETVYNETIELVSITPVESSVVRKITPRNDVSKKMVQGTIKELIARHFEGNDAKVAYAIIKAESSGNPRAVGYNCYYTKDGAVHEERVKGAISTHCKNGDRSSAWSLDCGVAQFSFPNVETCPEKSYNVEWSIAEMKKFHDTRGWSPWVAYNTKKHLAYME